ncbi:uncharacterized protein CIMG_09162 [Coccidioides immitis RS]|uniref:Uncharacterized protein n=1 Tax=Coccidioides immitis (strain RS) TaxID=246410 RepID=J3K1R7_COCIM|nr:uncharacterized protein CIMG_09162 [Coccidioides immitis RS]EAS27958.3 hypothetical protein CIMG_09162 [Coccidioides immitis RS]
MSKGPGDGANLPPEECGGGLRRVILIVRSAGEARMRWESSWEKRTGDDSLLDELLVNLSRKPTVIGQLPSTPVTLCRRDERGAASQTASSLSPRRPSRDHEHPQKAIKRASRLISRWTGERFTMYDTNAEAAAHSRQIDRQKLL